MSAILQTNYDDALKLSCHASLRSPVETSFRYEQVMKSEDALKKARGFYLMVHQLWQPSASVTPKAARNWTNMSTSDTVRTTRGFCVAQKEEVLLSGLGLWDPT